MGFLLAKILFLLVLAATGGALFAWWWFRRHYQDVTLDYARSRDEWASWRESFEERLATRPAVDLQPITQRLASLEAAVDGLEILERVDLAPVQARLEGIERRIGEIRLPEPPPPPDLAPTEKRLMAIEHALFPVQTRLDELESAIRDFRMPAPPTLDLAPVLERLADLRLRLENPRARTVKVRAGSRNLLSHAGHGKPDDLTRIKGVPKVLERTLHKVGVFYFWQIAEWLPEDVRQVDARLADYRGVIERDHWVSQASELAAAPTAAHRPLEH